MQNHFCPQDINFKKEGVYMQNISYLSTHLSSTRILISMFLMLSPKRAPATLPHVKCNPGLFPSLNLQCLINLNFKLWVTDNFPLGMTLKPVIHIVNRIWFLDLVMKSMTFYLLFHFYSAVHTLHIYYTIVKALNQRTKVLMSVTNTTQSYCYNPV